MNTEPVWLEVALNGGAGRDYQPNIPVTPEAIIEQGIECAKAGAAIVHLHVYNEQGLSVEDVDIYSRVIEGIKSKCDVIVYPTLGLSGSIEQRFEPIRILAERGLLEWGVVDPGSVNISHRSMVANGVDGIHYPNPDAHIRTGLDLAQENDWRPAFAIYEPGFARLGAAMAATYSNLKTPIYRIMLSDNLLFGMRPSEMAVRFYAEHLALEAPGAPWMLSGLDADIEAIAPLALKLGAHLRVGLEDAPFGADKSNLEMVKAALKTIADSGRPLASIAQIRASI